MSVASFGYQNQFLTAALSDLTHATGFGVANLAGQRQYPPYQTAAAATSLRFDLDSAAHTSWDCVALFGTNFTAAATIGIQVGTAQGLSDIYSALGLSCGVAPGYGQTIILNPSSAAGRWLRITVSDASNTDGFLRVGLAYAGPLWTPADNFDYDATNGWQDDSAIQVTRGGQEYDNDLPQYRTGNFSFGLLSETETFANVMEIDRLLAVKTNLLFIPDPAGTNMMKSAIFGRITKSDQPSHPDYGIHRKTYTIRERL